MDDNVYYLGNNRFYLPYKDDQLVEEVVSYQWNQNPLEHRHKNKERKYLFNKAKNLKLKQISNTLYEWNTIGKKVYKNNFWMSDECFESSPLQLLKNLISAKCYITIRFPNTITTLYDRNGNRTPYTIPVKDMYVFIPFRISQRNVQNVPKLTITEIYGFQAGFDNNRPFIYPHLYDQNDAFCLGNSELSTLTSLLMCNDISEDSYADVFELVLDYIDIMLGCQSNEGGPFRKLETLYRVKEIHKSSYFQNIISFYFLCVPKEKWVIKSITNEVITKDDYFINYDLIVEDFNLLFKQIEEYLPKVHKFDIRNIDTELKTYSSSIKKESKLLFKNKKIKNYYYNSKDIGYYTPDKEKVKKTNEFLNDKFKEEFIDYFIGLTN